MELWSKMHFFCQIYIFSSFVHHTHGHILRLPCLMYGNFSIVIPEQQLTGYVLKTFNSLDVDECENECIEHGGCKSINTKNTTGANCELNSKSTENPFDNLVLTASSGWTYRSTDYNAKNIGYYCQQKMPCPTDMTCMDTCTCPGYQCQFKRNALYESCQEAYKFGHTETKLYPLKIPGLPPIHARCDMKTDNDGWIVIQRRADATVSFYRGWAEYKAGFGDPNGNFWLGLDKMHRLAAPGKGAVLRVDVKHIEAPGEMKYAEYNTFEISDEANEYKLNIGQFSGDAGDSLAFQNTMYFSTHDHDRDTNAGNCAQDYSGGWWFSYCHHSFLNGLYPDSAAPEPEYMSWYSIKDKFGGIIFSEMKIKYKSQE